LSICLNSQLGGSDEETADSDPIDDSLPESSEPSPSSITKPSLKGSKPGTKSAKNAKKRQKKKEKKGESSKPTNDDDLDAILASVPQFHNNDAEEDKAADLRRAKMREILRVNSSLLDPDAEMQRLFGSDVVPNRGVAQVGPRFNNQRGGGGGGGGRQGGHGITVRKKTLLIKPRANWPPVGGGGKNDGMEMILKETKRGVNYFKYEWDRTYLKAQESFHRCVETGDPNSLAALMRVHPYHTDTLLQLHDAFQMTDEKDAALDLLERMIYRFESSFHSKFDVFSPDAASSIRLLYQEPENRSFMLGILSYIQEIGKKGCSQTALEWTKLLLSLDLSDPLGLLLLVDHFALRRREHAWLLRFYHSPLFEEHDLSILPNFVFSIALSAFYYRRNIESGDKTSEEDQGEEFKDWDPTTLIHNAMAMHPALFVSLCSRLAVGSIRSKGQNVLELPHFANSTTTVLPLVNVLCQLYIERNHAMWKDPACIQWLKDSAISFYNTLTTASSGNASSSNNASNISTTPSSDATTSAGDELQSKIDSYTVLVEAIMENPARIHRHVMLCEFNSVIRMLPSEVLREGFQIYEQGEIGAPQANNAQQQGQQSPQGAPGAAGQIARILDYLVPFQADAQQVNNLLNLIGYRMGGPDDNDAQDGDGNNSE
jgi:hypothetical protein